MFIIKIVITISFFGRLAARGFISWSASFCSDHRNLVPGSELLGAIAVGDSGNLHQIAAHQVPWLVHSESRAEPDREMPAAFSALAAD
jgi:hypothetical protein